MASKRYQSLMSQMGQTEKNSVRAYVFRFALELGHCSMQSARRKRAMCGRLRVGKKNLHFAAMVGAAMCSACLRGPHDRWP
jgi:hypothetical protein